MEEGHEKDDKFCSGGYASQEETGVERSLGM